MVVTPELRGRHRVPVPRHAGSAAPVGRTTPHEVAHQWFYGLVGNHQGRDPWMDEGIATYAEGRLEGTLNSMTAKAIPAARPGSGGRAHDVLGGAPGRVLPVGLRPDRGRRWRRWVRTSRSTARWRTTSPRNAHRIATPRDFLDSLEPRSSPTSRRSWPPTASGLRRSLPDPRSVAGVSSGRSPRGPASGG